MNLYFSEVCLAAYFSIECHSDLIINEFCLHSTSNEYSQATRKVIRKLKCLVGCVDDWVWGEVLVSLAKTSPMSCWRQIFSHNTMKSQSHSGMIYLHVVSLLGYFISLIRI
jgi:hypothetical protein